MSLLPPGLQLSTHHLFSATEIFPHPMTDKRLGSMFPPGLSIKDFGYPDTHQFHIGDYRLWYDGETVKGEDGGGESDEDNEDDIPSGMVDEDGDTDEINRQAIALFNFTPENDNEVSLREGQIIWISYRHGQGWLVAEDPELGENGLVPEEYVEICYDDHEVIEDIPRPFLPSILNGLNQEAGEDDDGEWVDTDFEDADGEDAEEGDALALSVEKLTVEGK